MLQVAKVTVDAATGAVAADRNASFHMVMQPPGAQNRDRGPVHTRTADPPATIAETEAMVIAASELERWSPHWRTGGLPPTVWNGTALVNTTQLLFRDPSVVREHFTDIARAGGGSGRGKSSQAAGWRLGLETGFGQRYEFVMSGLGKIEQMWNQTGSGRGTAMVPLRQFMRLDPGPGE
jgi:hypothetical protein